VLDEIKAYKNVKRVGLLATKGTIAGRVYHRVFEKNGYIVVTPEEEIQKKVMDVIYSVKAGNLKENVEKLKECIEEFESSVDVLIAACTEIPLLLPYIESKIPVFDATLSLAKTVIKFALD